MSVLLGNGAFVVCDEQQVLTLTSKKNYFTPVLHIFPIDKQDNDIINLILLSFNNIIYKTKLQYTSCNTFALVATLILSC